MGLVRTNNCTQERKVSLVQRLSYSLPVGAASILYGGPLVILQGIYAKHYGVPLTTIASILLIARLFDTITDPLIGYWSDRYHARNGTRKPFVFLGSVLFIISAYFLFSPMQPVNLLYLSVWFLAFYLGYTLFNVPHYAWGSEISDDSHSSTRLFTLRAMMMSIGLLLFYALPQLPFIESTEFTPEILRWSVIITGILLVVSLYTCLLHVPSSCVTSDSHNMKSSNRNQIAQENYLSIISLWKNVRHNKPFLIFLVAFFFWGIGLGSWGGLLYIFIDSYLDMGEGFSLVALIGVGGSLICIYFWARLAQCHGKIKAWIFSSLMTAASILSMAFLNPANPSFSILVVVMTLAYLGAASFMIFAPALLSDIIDYGTWKNGGQFAGSYFSIFLLATKANETIGVVLGLAIAGRYGFDPSSIVHSPEAIFGLQVAAIWLPALLLILSLVFINRIPLDARRHAVILRALRRRHSR